MAGRKRSRAPAKPPTSSQEIPDFGDELPIDPVLRRPGRPKGKNRKPLKVNQKRNRNNYYEHQRRDSHRALYNQIAEGLNLDITTTTNDILKAALERFKEPDQEIADLERINMKLQEQITILMGRLGDDIDISQLDTDPDDEITEPPPQRRRLYSSGVEEGEGSTSSSSASASTNDETPERQEEEADPSKLEEICSLIPTGVYTALECEVLIPLQESPLGPLPEGIEVTLEEIFDLEPTYCMF